MILCFRGYLLFNELWNDLIQSFVIWFWRLLLFQLVCNAVYAVQYTVFVMLCTLYNIQCVPNCNPILYMCTVSVCNTVCTVWSILRLCLRTTRRRLPYPRLLPRTSCSHILMTRNAGIGLIHKSIVIFFRQYERYHKRKSHEFCPNTHTEKIVANQ